MKDTALELVRREPKLFFSTPRERQHLLDRTNLPGARLRIRIPKKTIRGEWHFLTQPSAENVAHRHSPRLSQNIEARKFQRRQNLSPVIIKRCSWIGDEKSHLLQTGRIVSNQIRLHGSEYRFGRFPAPTHLAQSDQAVIGFHFNNCSNKTPPMAAVRMP